MITRPLLAQELPNLEDVKFPVYVSVKLDGIRCLKVDGKALSRSFKPIPNKYIQAYLQSNGPNRMDGEIITYTDGVADEFNVIQSKVMTEEDDPGPFIYWVFDYVSTDLNKPYRDRFTEFLRLPARWIKRIRALEYWEVNTLEELKDFEQRTVEEGFEGIMLRAPEGRYKCGRSTLKEGILLKFKRFEDSEAVILDIIEGDKNIGAKGINELGKTKRSHKKADKAKSGLMGEFHVKDLYTGVEFSVGTGIGLTKELREELLKNKQNYIGKIIKYKSQKCGKKDKPRFPSFLSFRDVRDMSE